MRIQPRTALVYLLSAILVCVLPSFTRAQSAGNAGTVTGSVLDPSAAAIKGATVILENSASGYTRTLQTDPDGTYSFIDVPFKTYRLTIAAAGFTSVESRVIVRSPVPQTLKNTLAVASAAETVTVQADNVELLETNPTFHTEIEREVFTKLPLESQSSGLSSLITLASPGVSADSNGLIHGLGDHAENAFYEDGQPITDQQSKVFSNQLPISAIQSLQIISGAPPAEYGEKTSLVAEITTRSGQGAGKPHGNVIVSYGTFGSSTGDADLSVGSQKYGNFLATDFLNTGRFLDPAEFSVFHSKGNEENVFDRVDFKPGKLDSAHLNASYTRSWFQTPNDYDNLNLLNQFGAPIPQTDQHSKIGTLNFAPSYTHVINDESLLTTILWVRRDHYNYFPSRNAFSDLGPIQSESISQDRSLTNTGARADYNYVKGVNNIKVGGTYQQTLLNERFNLGIVNPTLNSPCLNTAGAPVIGFTSPAQCAASGLVPNSAFLPLLGCLDLTRPTPSGLDGCATNVATPFIFRGHTDVKLLSFYAQDAITKGNFSANVGLRGDFYNGLVTNRQAEPRVAVSYHVVPSHTVLRASYARSMETPFNENLVLSSHGCNDAVISALVPCIPANFNPGFRNEFHAGLEQTAGKHLVITGDYLWKYTHNGYDFSVLGATPITFPIEWHNSKITGFDLRASVPDYHGLTAFLVMSSVSARFFPPQIGGLGATNTSGEPFRIDHDEKFNQTTHIQYTYKKQGPYFSFNWRYDSGEVAGGVPFAANSTTPVDLTILTADEQQQAGLYCGTQKATLSTPLTTCAPSQYHSSLVSIPAPGTENDDHNPPRIAPRDLFDLSVGEDRLLPKLMKNDQHTFSARVTAINLANKYALYNFLSTFSGTHYVTPRAITAELGYHF